MNVDNSVLFVDKCRLKITYKSMSKVCRFEGGKCAIMIYRKFVNLLNKHLTMRPAETGGLFALST